MKKEESIICKDSINNIIINNEEDYQNFLKNKQCHLIIDVKNKNENFIVPKSKIIVNKKNDNNDNNDNVSQKNKENSNSINNLNSSSLNSSKTIETVRTNIKNELIDYVSEKNERDTLISSNVPYSSEEINNENFPFEDTIIIHKNETLSSDLLPKNYLNNSNLNINIIIYNIKYN